MRVAMAVANHRVHAIPNRAHCDAVDRRIVLGGWAGIVGPVAYVAIWAMAGMVTPDYDPVSQAISELGAVGAPTRGAMSTGFVVFGLLALPFAVALRRGLPGDGRPAAASAVVCGLATVGAAVFPCTAGCPGPGATMTDTGHSVVAVVGYLALMATPLLVARQLRGQDRWRGFARWSLACGLVGSALMAAWALGLFGAAGGAAQRTFNTLADVWWASAGLVLLAGGGGGDRRSPPAADTGLPGPLSGRT